MEQVKVSSGVEWFIPGSAIGVWRQKGIFHKGWTFSLAIYDQIPWTFWSLRYFVLLIQVQRRDNQAPRVKIRSLPQTLETPSLDCYYSHICSPKWRWAVSRHTSFRRLSLARCLLSWNLPSTSIPFVPYKLYGTTRILQRFCGIGPREELQPRRKLVTLHRDLWVPTRKESLSCLTHLWVAPCGWGRRKCRESGNCWNTSYRSYLREDARKSTCCPKTGCF